MGARKSTLGRISLRRFAPKAKKKSEGELLQEILGRKLATADDVFCFVSAWPSTSVDKTKGREQDCFGNTKSDLATFSLIDGSSRCSRHGDVLMREKGAS